MDEFTANHLQTWADATVYDDEREEFVTWAHATLADDPALADMGWPALFRVFDRETVNGRTI